MTSLRGCRVLLTRPAGQSAALSALLRAAGATAVELPTLTIEPPLSGAPLDAALDRLHEYEWLVLTSPNGAAALGPPRSEASPRLAAVGPTTATALIELGWPTPWTASHSSAQTLADELPVRPGDRVLLLRSDIADPALPNTLAARGARVDDVVAYRTVPRRDPFATLPEADAFVFMSPSAIDGLLNALGDDAGWLTGKTVVAAGPTTAAHARARGLHPIEARQPTPEAILAALVETSVPAGASV